MDPLNPMDHWAFSLCHLTGLLPARGRCQHMTSFEITYLMHNQISNSSGLMPVHWIQWTKSNVHWTYLCPLDPMDNSNVHWTYCMSNGSIGSNGPLDILPLPSHRPATCMGSMPTYDVIQVNLLNGRRGVLQYITLYCILSGTDTTLCAWEAPF
jgi:hypothetical protein